MSNNSAPSHPPPRRKPLKFMDEHGASVNFLHQALQVEQTEEFHNSKPDDCPRMTFEAIKRKNAGPLRKKEASYVGLLFFATMEKLLKKGWVYAEHEASGEFRKIFSKELPWNVEDRLLMDRYFKHDGEQDLFILQGMAPEGTDQGSAPAIVVQVAAVAGNRCHFEIAVWNGIHFTHESKAAFESGVLAVPIAPAQDEPVDVDLWAKLDPNDAAWIERQIRILHRSFDEGTFPFDIQVIEKLCRCAMPALAADYNLQKVWSPVSICGAVHGDFIKLKNAITVGKTTKRARMLFLGGYVNGGDHQLHVICLLLLLKARYPDSYFLLRGDDEWYDMNWRPPSEGRCFADACKECFGPDRWEEVWNTFNDIFEYFPLAAVVDERIFCAYGGLPTNFDCLQDYEYACGREPRPISGTTPASCRLLAFAEGKDDDSAIDEDVLPQFLHNSRLTMFVRASQRPTLEGYTMLPDTKSSFSVSLSPSLTGKGVVLNVHRERPVKVDLVPSTLVEPLTPPNPLISFMRDLILGI